jgi:hypothetical protein
MALLVGENCPHCGTQIPTGPNQVVVACTYCKKSAFVECGSKPLYQPLFPYQADAHFSKHAIVPYRSVSGIASGGMVLSIGLIAAFVMTTFRSSSELSRGGLGEFS